METQEANSASVLADLLCAKEAPPTIAALPLSGRSVEVITMARRETRWPGSVGPSFNSVPNKPALDFEGRPAWAEIILVKLLERGGWQAVWAKNWHGLAFWRDVMDAVELPPRPAALFRDIGAQMTLRGGCWDILAWRERDFLFIESKQRRRDRLSPSQLAWLECALIVGVPLSAFAVVEWVAT